jgi:hypothetical protein
MANELEIYGGRFPDKRYGRELSISRKHMEAIALVTNAAVNEATVLRCYALDKVSTTLSETALIQMAAGNLSYQQREAVRQDIDDYLAHMKQIASAAIADIALTTNKLKR